MHSRIDIEKPEITHRLAYVRRYIVVDATIHRYVQKQHKKYEMNEYVIT